MAIIYSYTTKENPTSSDLIILSDIENNFQTKKASLGSLRSAIGAVGGSGTVNKIAMWSGTDTLTADSNISDENGAITINAGLSFTLSTDSSTKIAAGQSNVTLYSDTSATATTTSTARLATDTTGVLVYGQTIAAGATSERGGIIRYYNNANDRYVGISGPITTGTSYQIRLPDTVGGVGQVLAIASIDGSNAVMQWADNGSVVPSNPVAVDSMVTFDETVAGNGAAKITVSGGTPNYDVQIEETTTKQSFLINGSNNQTIFNFGTQAGGTSGSNLIAGTWQVLGGDSSTPQKLFGPLNKTFVIEAPPAPGCDVTTVSTTTDTSAPGASDGEVSIAISNGTPNYKVFITHSTGTPQQSKDVSTEPVTFRGLIAGTWTISGQDGNACDIPGSNGVATFIILDGSAPVPNPLALSNVTTYPQSVVGASDGAVSITVSGGTPDYNVEVSSSSLGQSFTLTGSGNQTVFNFGTQAGGTSVNNLGVSSDWQILGGDSAGGDFSNLSNNSFTIEPVVCNMSATTKSITSPTSASASDGSAQIEVTGGTPQFQITVKDLNQNPIYNQVIAGTNGQTLFDFSQMKVGTYTVTGIDSVGCEFTPFSFAQTYNPTPGPTTLRISQVGEGYLSKSEYLAEVVNPASTGSGLTATVTDVDGSGPRVVSPGSNYTNGETIQLIENPGQPKPTIYAQYTVII